MSELRQSGRAGHLARLLIAALLLLGFGGCMRGCTSPRPPLHPNPNMDLQPKYKAQSASAFFYDGMTMRQPVEGTVARGELEADSALAEGRSGDGTFVIDPPIILGEDVLARGKERYGIYCTPCHGDNGNGRGVLFERAQIQAGNLHDPRIVDMPAGELYDVITNGVGLMAGYRYPIKTHDRWAIVAYVRQLQQDGES